MKNILRLKLEVFVKYFVEVLHRSKQVTMEIKAERKYIHEGARCWFIILFIRPLAVI